MGKGKFMKLSYRADLDGLRAIAVLAVVFMHVGFSIFSGGYIGVDIFFVISGFLITTIIAREIKENEFTLLKFYERRIRRILPALTVMVVFALLASALLYDSGRFKSFSKSLLATMLFYSNINFLREAGYFDAPSLLKPLLHTWSLAVEEQFYIVFPLFMYGIHTWARKYVKPILSIVALLSLTLAIYTVNHNDATSAFYLAHMRAWELLVGGLLALNIFPATIKKGINTTLGLVGGLMIFIPIFLYSDQTPFPGLSAVVPVLGTALIIYSSTAEMSPVGKILGAAPLVFIGQISYSLYLWHWPLVIFAKYYIIRPMTGLELLLLLSAIFAISTLSWRFVETPFRSRQLFSTSRVFALGLGAMAVIVAAAGVVYYFDGFPAREGPMPLVEFMDKETTNRFTRCANVVDDFDKCVLAGKSHPASFMLWGDSHADSLREAVERSARRNGFSGLFTYKLSCPPLVGMTHDFRFVTASCIEYNKEVIQYLIVHPEISTIILAGRWSYYIEGSEYKPKESFGILAGFPGTKPKEADSEQLVEFGLEQTVQTLLEMNRKVVIVSQVPEIGYDVPSANFIALRSGRDINQIIAPSMDEYFNRNQKTLAILGKLKEKQGVQVVDPWTVLCIENKCRVTIDGRPLYKDDDHLSLFGAEVVSGIFEPVFAQ
jgi:peptidoglycan/LPS O-acetylase OafA/YrhL